MEVLSIERLTKDDGPSTAFINESLEKGSYCEVLYHQYMLKVVVTYESNKDILVRLYHESYRNALGQDIACHTQSHSPNKLTFWMSLMDAIDYIYKATPPALQKEIKPSITSIDNIIEILKTYVIENNSDKQLRLGMFLKENGFFEFDTIWEIPEKIRKIRNIVGDGPTIGYVDIDTPGYVKQYIISCPLNKLMDLSQIISELRIINVCVDESSLTRPPIVYIKGFWHNVTGNSFVTDKLCDNTIKLCEAKLSENK